MNGGPFRMPARDPDGNRWTLPELPDYGAAAGQR